MADERPAADRRLGLLWGAAALALIAVSPLGRFLTPVLPGCLFKSLSGIPCPLCGTMRSALALARFDLLGALTHYPLPTLAWIGLIGGGLVAGVLALGHRPLPRLPRIPRWAMIAAAAAVVLNWIYSIATGV